MSQPKLILVKHSLPIIDPELPASQWELSQEGEKRCILLAQHIAPYQPAEIFSSHEPKAIQTARIVAQHLDLLPQVAEGLHEHERPKPGLLSSDEYEKQVKALFTHPEERVFGMETAHQAQARFFRAIMQLTYLPPQKTTVIISHGTVISLFLQLVCQVDPFPLWKSLKLPSFVVLSLPGYQLEQIFPSIIPENPTLTEGR